MIGLSLNVFIYTRHNTLLLRRWTKTGFFFSKAHKKYKSTTPHITYKPNMESDKEKGLRKFTILMSCSSRSKKKGVCSLCVCNSFRSFNSFCIGAIFKKKMITQRVYWGDKFWKEGHLLGHNINLKCLSSALGKPIKIFKCLAKGYFLTAIVG